MTEHEHDHHAHEGHEHDHDHDHDHDHALISDRLPEGIWHLDPEGSDLIFKSRGMFGLVPVTGVFDQFSGDLSVSSDGSATGTLTVETESLQTGIDKRDTHLRSADFFHAAEHPHMLFTVDRVEPSGQDHLNLTGTLQIRDTRIPVQMPVYAIAHGDHLHLEGRTVINHHAAGLRWAKPGMVTKTAKVEVALTLVR